jgi:hypothetical protein
MTPRADWLAIDAPDGYWRVSPRARLSAVRRKADALGRTALYPYLPRYDRAPVEGSRAWETSIGGVIRATNLTAMRLESDDHAADPSASPSLALLQLVTRVKLLDPQLRWIDLGDLASWPVSLRVDAKRLQARLERVSRGTWCTACDDSPWASETGYCLWCERQGAAPMAARPAVERQAAA